MTSRDPFERNMPDDAFEAYLQLCQEIYLEMQNSDTWPWADSPNSGDLLESDDS